MFQDPWAGVYVEIITITVQAYCTLSRLSVIAEVVFAPVDVPP